MLLASTMFSWFYATSSNMIRKKNISKLCIAYPNCKKKLYCTNFQSIFSLHRKWRRCRLWNMVNQIPITHFTYMINIADKKWPANPWCQRNHNQKKNIVITTVSVDAMWIFYKDVSRLVCTFQYAAFYQNQVLPHSSDSILIKQQKPPYGFFSPPNTLNRESFRWNHFAKCF